MEVREIKALINLMNDYGLVELEIEDKKGKIRLVRGVASDADADSAPTGPSAGTARAAKGRGTAQKVAAVSADDASAKGIEIGPNQRLVESPMVGTFYRAASPDSAPFVEEGSAVRKGQPVCIIEAMKMMNEIEAPVAGRVVKILVENGQPVEYGQPMLILEIG
jgi:acetyl-CoA carboxylase biotin carboxyl carrier protein